MRKAHKRNERDNYLEELLEDHTEGCKHLLNGGKPEIKDISDDTRRFFKVLMEESDA